MRKIFSSLVAVAVLVHLAPAANAGWFSPPALERYTGPDAGRLVMSLAGYRGADYDRVSLFFRCVGESKRGVLDYSCRCRDLFGLRPPKPNTDFADNFEAANVFVWPLAPGNYEIYDFDVSYAVGINGRSTFSSKAEFSIPFTIEPGRTIYLGEFRAMDLNGRNIFGLPVPAGVKFQIFDKSARDLTLAKARESAITEFKISLPDPSQIDSPLFERTP
jgi:hypothetical protein